MTSVFLVDDHALFLTGVRAELEAGFDVLGVAGDVDTAIDDIRRLKPEVVLVDVHMPGGGGVAVVSNAAESNPDIRFLALSVSDAPEDVIAMIRAGCRGYVTKSISPADLADAIDRVATGHAVFSPSLAGFVLDVFARAVPVQDDPDLDQLTPREQEVLRQIARGYQYKQIAKRLGISIKTVESHVSSVLRKLQLSNRHELARWASDRRIV
ncbi:MAG: response regulator transcription factor [Acidimicrobiia bacterium]|nr:MAG: response regulator transcription factor [Acidimicrobiia bacterium]